MGTLSSSGKQKISETYLKVGVTGLVVGSTRSVWFDYHYRNVDCQICIILAVIAAGILLTTVVSAKSGRLLFV